MKRLEEETETALVMGIPLLLMVGTVMALLVSYLFRGRTPAGRKDPKSDEPRCNLEENT